MANFIRKLVERKSRSKSPVKSVTRNGGPGHGVVNYGDGPMNYGPGSGPLYSPSPASLFAPWATEPSFHPEQRHQLFEKYNDEYASRNSLWPPNRRETQQPFMFEPSEKGQQQPPPPPSSAFLPVPPALPSPLPGRSNSSRQSYHNNGANNAYHSDDSLGIRSWHTEKEDSGGGGGGLGSGFYLNRGGSGGSGAMAPTPEQMLAENEQRDASRLFDDDHDAVFFRGRSESPRKGHTPNSDHSKQKHRSKSPVKKRNISHTFDYLTSQCHQEGCTAGIIVQNARFLVCRHQISHASDYFRNLLHTDRRSAAEFTVAVSGMACPSPVTQFKWFIESTIPFPALRDIGDDTLETCMRLSRRFESKTLELRCNKYIIENVSSRQPMLALCWLNWCLQHGFAPPARGACLAPVARLPLATLEQHRQMLSERVFADLVAAKLRSCYDKAASVFETIHRLDHFTVELERCPRCGRTKEQGTVRVHAFPCRKLLGCEKCTRELNCELAAKAEGGMQAFFQCPHTLLPLNDTSEDCFCQTQNLAEHLNSSLPSLHGTPHIDSRQVVGTQPSHQLQPPPLHHHHHSSSNGRLAQ